MPYFYLVSAVLFNSLANILLKTQAQKGLDMSSFNLWYLITHNYLFITSVIAFAVNLIFYLFALRHIPISVAYPIMIAFSFIIINGSAHVIFHEQIQLLQILGYLLILVGLSLVVVFTPRV